MQRLVSKGKEKYQMQFSPDAQGLSRMVAFYLNLRQKDKVKWRDSDTAERLGVVIENLHTLQSELEADGLFYCRRGQTQSWYGFIKNEEWTQQQ